MGPGRILETKTAEVREISDQFCGVTTLKLPTRRIRSTLATGWKIRGSSALGR